MSLQSASMLVKITVRFWDGFKKDRNVTEQVDKAFHTTGGAGNYNKRLLDKSVLAPIQKICTRIRYDHKFFTIPWCYDGVDLLPSKLYFEYTQAMRLHKDAYEHEVNNLVDQYPVHKSNQSVKLGTMYNPEDYPKRDELKARYGVDFMFFPVPQEGHFVVDLEAKEATKLKQELNLVLSEAQNGALRKVYARVLEMLEHLHERLSDPANVFRDSLVSNFVQLATVLPGLNIFEDPKLTRAASSLENLVYIDPEKLRTDPLVRAKVAEALYDVIAQLKGAES
jgi:hypothetical protein